MVQGVRKLRVLGILRARRQKRARNMSGLYGVISAFLTSGLAISGTAHAQTLTSLDIDQVSRSEELQVALSGTEKSPASDVIASLTTGSGLPDTSRSISDWDLADDADGALRQQRGRRLADGTLAEGAKIAAPLSYSPVSYSPLPHSSYGPRQVEGQPSESDDRLYRSFGSQFSTVKWEVGAIFAYMTVTQLILIKDVEPFHFQNEGWFGKSTNDLGVDKLTHAFNSYLITEFLQARIRRKTDGAVRGGVTAAVLAASLMAWSEFFDAHKTYSGWSNQDVISNIAGAGFSALRHAVPGLKEKLDFRELIIPNSDLYTFKGKRHFAQQRFLLALQLAGFDRFKESPLRFLELHAGYYGKDFTASDRAQGITPKRRLFFGVGFNLNELFFKRPGSRVERAASSVLDYLQIPYTAAHFH